ncbi:MAG TPA: C40 family peptidase [Blastocatellia bacterium]|nr:C40 family peptidase [Blastocatellia bacterium]
MLSHKRLNISIICLAIIFAAVMPAVAQDGATRPRRVNPQPQTQTTETTSTQTTQTTQKNLPRFDGTLATEDIRLPYVGAFSAFRINLMQSIESLLGTPYRYGANGDGYGIDCSGFVWRVYHQAGLDFQRTSAADMFYRFPAATDEQKTQFGTLVFFNNLGHVGIVKDKDHFYHASSHQGVTLSSFKGYWEDRIVGYRVVQLTAE